MGCTHRDLAVAYLDIWGESHLHPVLHSAKQQCLTAYIDYSAVLQVPDKNKKSSFHFTGNKIF